MTGTTERGAWADSGREGGVGTEGSDPRASSYGGALRGSLVSPPVGCTEIAGGGISWVGVDGEMDVVVEGPDPVLGAADTCLKPAARSRPSDVIWGNRYKRHQLIRPDASMRPMPDVVVPF